jgi:hypothetical protein
MSAVTALLSGLIDYAGLYPPAGLDMRSAVRNYLSYSRGRNAMALGRFIVEMNRLEELRAVAGDSLRDMALSVIAAPGTDWNKLRQFQDNGFSIDAVEIKSDRPVEIEQVKRLLPPGTIPYFEIPILSPEPNALVGIAAVKARAKLRMGGVVAEAFPQTQTVADALKALVERRIPFKATAGLHHPIRSAHALTYDPESPKGVMHGFLNLCCAAALLHFGGEGAEAKVILEEENPSVLRVNPRQITWGAFCWSEEQLRTVRAEFFISFGSCSFTEPIEEMEALGWL